MGSGASNCNNQIKIKSTTYKNIGMNEYIYKLDINIPNSKPPEFIFIVDKSSLMGSDFKHIITKTIPDVLNSLGYENKKIHLITFNNDIIYSSISQLELRKSNPCSDEGKIMSNIFDVLEKIFFISEEKCNNLRILTISNGKIFDQEDTKHKGELLFEKYKNTFKINSQCIRLFTSSEDPDISGIVSTLKFNNVNCCDLVNHDGKQIGNLEEKIIKLFINDGLVESNFKIKGNKEHLKNFPWEETSSNTLPLKKGKNIFFCNKNNDLCVYYNNNYITSIKSKNGEEINNNNYKSIIGQEKIYNIFQRFTVNKTLNTNESKKENMLISNYFENLYKNTKKINNYKTLEFLKEKLLILNEKNISNLGEEIKALYIKEIDEEKINYEKYRENYNEKDFWIKIKDVGKKIGIKPLYAAFLLYYALPKVSLLDKVTIIGSLGYFISPLDLIPDVIPGIGLIDDAAVLTWAFFRISSNTKNIDDEVKRKAKTKIKGIFDNISNEELEHIL